MNANYTPGNWKVHSYSPSQTRGYIGEEACIIAEREYPNSVTVAIVRAETILKDEIRANAALIAAAPELLSALEKCANVIGMGRLQGKLSDNPFSPVNDALMAAHAVLDKLR